MRRVRFPVSTVLPLIGLVLFSVSAGIFAAGDDKRPQQPPALAFSEPTFEVASVKPNTSGSRGRSLGYPPNRFVATNVPLRVLIGNAYGDTISVRQDMIVGGPGWIDSDGFDIEAKATSSDDPAAVATVAARKLMLRRLLAERFALTLHAETRDLPIYALVIAKAGGKVGPALTSSTGQDCVSGRPTAAAPDAPPCGPGGPRPRGEAGGYFVTMAEIAKIIGQFLDRPVVDKTGLPGRFTFELHFTPPPRVVTAPGASPDPIDPNLASIFTAVQEQLGLKLEAQHGPVEVLVIDAAKRPTPD